MKELIEFMARAIVENPDAVDVTEEDAGDHFVFYLKVADDDMGRVIGKQGRIANAMRTMLKVAAIRRGVRAVLEIGEPRADRGGQRRDSSYSDRDDYDRDTAHGEDAGYDAPREDTGGQDTSYDAPQEDSGNHDEDDAHGEDQTQEDTAYGQDERDDQ